MVGGKTGIFLPQQLGLDPANKPPPGPKEPFPEQQECEEGWGQNDGLGRKKDLEPKQPHI